MIIKCMSKDHFDRAMLHNGITDNNVEENVTKYFISIIGFQDLKYNDHYFKHLHKNVLNLEFDDCENKRTLTIFDREKGLVDYETVPFTEEQAEQIINFIKDIQDTDNTEILVHCIAGQSRSGAVGEFLTEYFEYPYNQFIFRNPQVKPNNHVRLTLRKTLEKLNGTC